MAAKQYRRSWRNLLLNKRYQLRFTALLLSGAAIAFGGLGYWVLSFSKSATVVAESQLSSQCWDSQAASGEPDVAKEPSPVEEQVPGRRRVTAVTTESETLPPALVARALVDWDCRIGQRAGLADVRAGHRHVIWALVGSGVVLMLCLAALGIKLTHKVAGPLFKVTQYFRQMQAGRFTVAYPLRRGDQLVQFYEHFRAAHEALRAREIALAKALRVAANAFSTQAPAELHNEIAALEALAKAKEAAIE